LSEPLLSDKDKMYACLKDIPHDQLTKY